MIWNRYDIETTTKDFELLSAILVEHGIKDIQIDNNVQLSDDELNQMYADFAKELPEDDGSCIISFYLDEDMCVPGESLGTGDSPGFLSGEKIDLKTLEKDLSEAVDIFDIDPVKMDVSSIDTKDFEDNWKNFFKPFEVDGIVIKPTWEEIPKEFEEKVIINIDPGMAFGTGMHETTKLCLKGLKKYLKENDLMLDLGCGSGILGIAALKLGAKSVTAIDIDEQAVKVAFENFELNIAEDSDIYEKDTDQKMAVFSLNVGNITDDKKIKERISEIKYDVVCANILAEVIIKLFSDVDKYMKKGGYFITSGILKDKESLVLDVSKTNPSLEYVETVCDGEWISIVFKAV